jgi:hypothetical protein
MIADEAAIYTSRFHADATGDQVLFERGERIRYRWADGEVSEATIDSGRMSHPRCPNLGYECLDADGHRFFADGTKIVLDGYKAQTVAQDAPRIAARNECDSQ